MGDVVFELCGRGVGHECEIGRVERQAVEEIWRDVIAGELFLKENVVRGSGFDGSETVRVETEHAVRLVQRRGRCGHPGRGAAAVQIDRRGGECPIEKSAPVKFVEDFLTSRFTFKCMHRADREAATHQKCIIVPWVGRVASVSAIPDGAKCQERYRERV